MVKVPGNYAGRKIIYGRSQGSGTERFSEPVLRLATKNGRGQVRVLIPKDIGVEIGARAHLWISQEHVHFGVSFEDGGRLKVHGPKSGNGSLFVLGSVDDESFEILKGHRWQFSDVCHLNEEPESITFVGEKGSTAIDNPKPRKKPKV